LTCYRTHGAVGDAVGHVFSLQALGCFFINSHEALSEQIAYDKAFKEILLNILDVWNTMDKTISFQDLLMAVDKTELCCTV